MGQVPAQERTGYFDVINNRWSRSALKQGFRYRLPDGRPVVRELSPSRGPVIGHIIVAIIGEIFVTGGSLFWRDYGLVVKSSWNTIGHPPHTDRKMSQ